MGEWDVLWRAPTLFGFALAVVVVPAVVCHAAEQLVLDRLLAHPSRARGTHRQLAGTVLAVLVAAVLLLMSGLSLGVLVLTLLGREVSDAEFLAWCGGGVAVVGLHAGLTWTTARRGWRLAATGPWRADRGEGRHRWTVLTRQMPLRSWDLLWLFTAAALPVGELGWLVIRSRPDGPDAGGTFPVYTALWVVAFAGGLVAIVLDRVRPHLTLARWAADEHARRRDATDVWATGPRAARLTVLCARRRARSLPVSLRERYLTGGARLAQCIETAYLQQQTSPQAAVTLRDAVQHSARLACSLDAFAALRQVERWLGQQGLADLPVPPLPQRRFDPLARDVDTAVKLVRNLASVTALLIGLGVAVRAGLDPGALLDALR